MALDLDPGAAAVGNQRLVQAIIQEMDGGAISFQRFMELALYHPQFGYYRRPGRVGKQGDFLTSPGIHAMFGWTVAGWCQSTWEALGCPAEFHIVEAGAGEGALATSILDWAHARGGDFADSLRYIAIEPNSPGNDPRVDWSGPRAAPVANGVLIANELFDALPVRLFDATGRGPVEVLVRWDGERFVETPGSVAAIDGAPKEGRFEVSPDAYPLMRNLSQLITRGAILLFDYGYPQADLWAPWRSGGTLLCFYRHTAHEDPLIHIGDQDLTTHVNFSDLAAALDDEGLTVFGPVKQSAFLASLGLSTLVEAARKDIAEYFARRRALEQLTDGAGLGRIGVLAATRGIAFTPPGFESE